MYFLYFFFFLENFDPENSKYFSLDKNTRVLTLIEMLDRESIETHDIQVIASRSSIQPPARPSSVSILLVTIIVLDVNDNPPIFEYDLYRAGITTSDYLTKLLVRVIANDADLNDTVTYYNVPNSLNANGNGIKDIVDPFKLDDVTGAITLNFQPQDSMDGFFEFLIEARDTDGKNYLINLRTKILIFVFSF